MSFEVSDTKTAGGHDQEDGPVIEQDPRGLVNTGDARRVVIAFMPHTKWTPLVVISSGGPR